MFGGHVIESVEKAPRTENKEVTVKRYMNRKLLLMFLVVFQDLLFILSICRTWLSQTLRLAEMPLDTRIVWCS